MKVVNNIFACFIFENSSKTNVLVLSNCHSFFGCANDWNAANKLLITLEIYSTMLGCQKQH